MNLTGGPILKQSTTSQNRVSFIELTAEFDTPRARVIVSAQFSNNQELFFVFESIWVPRWSGRIGKRVRIPRGRATVMRRLVTALWRTVTKRSSKPGDLPSGFAALERFAERRSGRTGS